MLKVVGIFALVAVASAAVSRYPPEPKPEKYAGQEGCYLSSLDKVLPYDTPYNSGKPPCGQYVCQKSTNETLFETCGVIAPRDGCQKSPEDLTKNYPECCSKEVCDATTTTPVPTTPAPSQPSNQGSSANAYAKSGGGQPPVTVTSTSGADASASATAS